MSAAASSFIEPLDDSIKADFSPTQISTHVECERKWAWKRIAKIHEPPSPSAALGTRVHSVLEKYLGNGEMPDFVADGEAAKIAASGLHLLPAPKTPGVLLEQEFRFRSRRTGFVYGGFKDVDIAPGVAVPALEIDGSFPSVIDHKTTKSIADYAKSRDDLECDAQSTIYGLDSMARFDASAADLSWNYLQTQGPRIARPTRLRLPVVHALRVFDEIERVAESAQNAIEKKLQPLDLPPNPDACRGFGGCPYRHLCNLSPSQIVRSRMSNSIISTLRDRVQGRAPAVTEKPAEQPKEGLFGDPTKVPAPNEIPAAFATPKAESDAPVKINPPESELAPPPVQTAAEPAAEEPKRGRGRPKATKDPKGADANAATAQVPAPEYKPTAPQPYRDGFTLYVDCLPIGRPAKMAALLIAKAQERMATDGPRDANGSPVPDYRLVDYGKGTPAFVAFVLDQVDGTFDLALDTRSPEGGVLLEPLMAKASFVVRGLR